jgi:hypothetical protein
VVVAHAIGQVSGDLRGIHVLVFGPHAWIYAPDGWLVERRLWQRPKGRRVCANLRDALLVELRGERELETPIGIATLRDGTWMHPAGGPPRTAEVLTVDLKAPTAMATVAMPGPNWTAYGLRSRKVVAAASAQTALGQVILSAPAIDRVVVHAQHADEFQVCALLDTTVGTGWTEIAHLQLPLREVDSSLADEADEWDRARSRLIPGDDLDQATFAELASALRAVPGGTGEGRPIDRSIWPDPESPDTVLGALDPLRLALLDPQMRRALGLAHFDDDPVLQLGQTYEYRVSAKFPPDAATPRPGFHTVPVGTQVPADFFLGDVRVRLSQPSRVELVPTGVVDELVVGRRAIPVGPRESPHWLLPHLLDAAVVLDFAEPRSGIVLELADADLRFDAFDAEGGFVGGGDLASGDAVLTFSGPCTRVILRGKARWLGLRETAPAGSVLFDAVTDPVVFAEPPPPPVPLSIAATVAGLSTPTTGEPYPRSELGFDVTWRPALALDANAWPQDADAAPPLEATRFELEHEQLGEGFRPVFGKDGLAFGDRGGKAREPFAPGADVALVFPEQPPPPVGAVQDFTIRDHFLRDPETSPPQPGTEHRYRIRALDEIGRPSAWVTGAPTLLEKRFPPPQPVGPPSAEGLRGVRARVLVRDAPDLTAADQALLDENGSTTAIVLTWAWTDEQRSLDPWASEFRVYASSGGVGPVPGAITAVTDLGGGHFAVDLGLFRAVAAEAARGGYLPADGEYRILSHTAGTTIQATVETLIPNEDGSFPAPRVGPTVLPVPLAASHSKPDAWEQRLEVVPLADAEVYELVLLDLLLPSADAPRTATWLGVSAADVEPYVADSFPGGNKPGNESPLVAVRCEARYHGRPELDVPPPIGDVPAVTTARATAAGIEHDLDLLPFLAGTGLAAGEPVAVEQLSDGDLLAALRLDGTDVVAVPPPTAPRDADEIPIAIPNPSDRAEITAALADDPLGLADRYVVWLAASHPYADWLFSPLEPIPQTLGQSVHFSFDPGAARYVVRVRRVDAAWHRSAGSATCAMVVRVPVLAPLAPPDFLGAEWTMTPDGPRVQLRAAVPDERTTHLLTWTASTDPRQAELAAIGSRRDLPGFGVRLRPLDGSSLTPSVIALQPAAGTRTVTTLEAAGPGPHFVWLAAVDQDGVPSRLSGAYRLPPRTA